MKLFINRQRPALRALAGAVVFLLAGVFLYSRIHQRVLSGEIDDEKLRALIFITVAIAGTFLAAAAARYQFNHRWLDHRREVRRQNLRTRRM